MIESLSGKRIGIVGIARSGLGAARLVHRLGGNALLSDIRDSDALADELRAIRDLNLDVETGEHRRITTEKFSFIILSPGVVPSHETSESWRRSGIPVISEMEFASRVCIEPWIGVTGSNGKTTTVNLIAHILRQTHPTLRMAGNVGQAWSDLLADDPHGPWIIEVSSFQLEHSPSVHPRVGVILNIFENHLDRHASIDEYTDLKFRLLKNQTEQDVAILNGDDSRLSVDHRTLKSRVIHFGESGKCEWKVFENRITHGTGNQVEFSIHQSEIPLLGRHNLFNAAAAAAATHGFGANYDTITRGLQSAEPVEHRLEPVRELRGIRFVNDSKSTNLTATTAAVNAIEPTIILLFGGRPKKESFLPLRGFLASRVRRIIVFGEARSKVRKELPTMNSIHEADNIEAALMRACKAAHPGETVLLSPGCASFDQFRDFEERGRKFKSLVLEL